MKQNFLIHRLVAVVAAMMCAFGANALLLTYACYTPSNTTLTFYYDDQRNYRPGTIYDLNTDSNLPAWYEDGTNAKVTRVAINKSFAGTRPTTTYGWFDGMKKLQSIEGLSYLNTSEVTNMARMFAHCELLTSLDLSHFDTSQVTNMNSMFLWAYSLYDLDMSGFNTANVTDMQRMFNLCYNLTTINAGESWNTASVTNSTDMFEYCEMLVGGMGTGWDLLNPTDKTYARIDGGSSNPGYFTAASVPEAYTCYTPSDSTLTFYYDALRSSRPGSTFDLNEGMNPPRWFLLLAEGVIEPAVEITQVVFDPSFERARPKSTYHWFSDLYFLRSFTGMEYLNTSEVTNMQEMFTWVYATGLDVSGFDTHNVTNMSLMFYGCGGQTSFDVRGWNTENVTDMSSMFRDCSDLTSLDLSHFNTSNVTDMQYMFYYNHALTKLDLSGFNTANVKSMRAMFDDCRKLQTITVSSEWNTDAVTASWNMFDRCTCLVGGQGTTYDSSNPTDKTYAHIDGGPSNPGYLTWKSSGIRGDIDNEGNVNITDVTVLINYLLSRQW